MLFPFCSPSDAVGDGICDAICDTSKCSAGFQYESSEYIVVDGSIKCSAVIAHDGGLCSDGDDELLDNAEQLVWECGNNVLGDSKEVDAAADCGDDCVDGTAHATHGFDYAITAENDRIYLVASALIDIEVTYLMDERPCNCGKGINGSSATASFDPPFTVNLPFTINCDGAVVVRMSELGFDGGSPACGAAHGAWGINGDNFSIGDSYDDTDEVRSWSRAQRVFGVCAGDYIFQAEFHASGSAVEHTCKPGFVDGHCHPSAALVVDIAYTCPGFFPCDANCDGKVNYFDIDAFALAVADPTGYATSYPACDLVCNNDTNGDGFVNNFDVDSFLECLGL